MTKDEFGADVRLRILVLDGLESLVLVVAQRDLNVVKTGGFDVVDVIGEEDRVLHGVHRTSTAAWKELQLKDGDTKELVVRVAGKKR